VREVKKEEREEEERQASYKHRVKADDDQTTVRVKWDDEGGYTS